MKMKRIFAFAVLAVMLAAMVPAVAETRTENHYCRVCGTITSFAVCNDYHYESADASNHIFYMQDNAVCTVCGNVLYNADWPPYMEPHNFVNDECVICGYSRDNSKKLVFVCSDSVKVRSQPGGGAQLAVVKYGSTFDFVELIPVGNDGDPWFHVIWNGQDGYIAGGTLMSNGSFWSYRRACRIKYYGNTKVLSATKSTYLVKNPDAYTGDNKKDAVAVAAGFRCTCYGEVVDELFPNKIWYLVKYDGAWFFVPASDANVI